jgi:hypothetical protein
MFRFVDGMDTVDTMRRAANCRSSSNSRPRSDPLRAGVFAYDTGGVLSAGSRFFHSVDDIAPQRARPLPPQ